jgi:hypothetical protein
MYYEWTRVLLVCRRIRAIAVHAPALWNVLGFSSRRSRTAWRALYLERSVDTLLCATGIPIEGGSILYTACVARLVDHETDTLHAGVHQLRMLALDRYWEWGLGFHLGS